MSRITIGSQLALKFMSEESSRLHIISCRTYHNFQVKFYVIKSPLAIVRSHRNRKMFSLMAVKGKVNLNRCSKLYPTIPRACQYALHQLLQRLSGLWLVRCVRPGARMAPYTFCLIITYLLKNFYKSVTEIHFKIKVLKKQTLKVMLFWQRYMTIRPHCMHKLPALFCTRQVIRITRTRGNEKHIPLLIE